MMAYNVGDQIRIIRKGQAVRAQYPVPPGVAGHDPEYRPLVAYDPRAANALLEKAGYKKGADGYRRQPGGASPGLGCEGRYFRAGEQRGESCGGDHP